MSEIRFVVVGHHARREQAERLAYSLGAHLLVDEHDRGANWNSDGAIKTTYGTISPGASDERVKNIVREITEEEAIRFISEVRPIRYAFKWRPEQIKVGFRAQNIEALDPELVEITSLTIPGLDGSDIVIQDGKMIDPGEIGAAYLVPVVQQLLRRVSELEAEIKTLNPQGS